VDRLPLINMTKYRKRENIMQFLKKLLTNSAKCGTIATKENIFYYLRGDSGGKIGIIKNQNVCSEENK
jgi:hypothetical protein